MDDFVIIVRRIFTVQKGFNSERVVGQCQFVSGGEVGQKIKWNPENLIKALN